RSTSLSNGIQRHAYRRRPSYSGLEKPQFFIRECSQSQAESAHAQLQTERRYFVSFFQHQLVGISAYSREVCGMAEKTRSERRGGEPVFELRIVWRTTAERKRDF